MLRRLLWAGLAGLTLGALVLAAAPHAQLLNAGRLSVAVKLAQTVFDNGGNPWPFSTSQAGVNYNICGANCAYVATPSLSCPVPPGAAAYRSDNINFKTDAGQTPAFRIGCFFAGQSYNYIENISTAGPYQVNLTMANGGGSSALVSILVDGGTTPVATASIGVTGDYDTFAVFSSGSFNVALGNHIITIACTTGDSSFNGCGDLRSFVGVNSASIPTPTVAQNAGLTTLARNWDWSQPQYANQSSWLDCNDADASKEWHKGSPGEFAAQLPCDINQGLDDQGNTVLVYNFTTAYSNTSNCQSSGNGQCFQSMQTANFSPAQQMAFPNGSYMEIDVKESNSLYNNGNNNGSGPDGMYVVTNDPTDNNAMLLRPQWIEHDPGELWTSASGFANGNLMVYPEQSPGGVWFSFNSQNNLPSGWSVTTYHKYAVMSTVNASGTSMYSCLFVDDILQQRCFAMDLNANPRIPFYPQRIIVWSGGGGVAVNKKMYVKTVRVWSCSNWQGQMTDHGNVYCGGNTLFDNGSLRYWH